MSGTDTEPGSRPLSVEGRSEIGDEISDLARRRREDAEKESIVPPPNFILSVQQSEFSLVLDPQAVPLRYADPDTLLSLIDSYYSATLESPDLGALIRSTSFESVQAMPFAERLKRAWALTDGNIQFENGKLPTKYGFVPIRSIYIDFEKVIVSVAGITSLAEAVAYEVLELMWRSAGVERRYSEIEDAVRLVSYATVTGADFGDSANRVLGDTFRGSLTREFSQGGQFAGAFGSRSHRNNFKPSTNVVSSVTLDELHIQVSQFDRDTGASYTGLLKLSVRAKDDHGSGRMTIASHLPYEEHVALLGTLRDALVGKPAER